MLLISQKQQDSLAKDRREAFAAELARHLKAFAPDHVAPLGDPDIAEIVEAALNRGMAHGFDMRGPARTYLEAMVLLGWRFDEDPLFIGVLGDAPDAQDGADQVPRAMALYDFLSKYAHATYGADGAAARDTLQRLAEAIERPAPKTTDLGVAALAEMESLLPAPVALVGRDACAQMLGAALETARSLGARSAEDRMLCCRLATMLGHGFADDPQYPWVRDRIANIADAGFDPLHRAARVYLHAALARLGPGGAR